MENEDSSIPGWSASFFMQTTEDVASALAAAALAAAASAATVRSPRPSIVYSSSDENGNSPIQRLHNQVSRVLKGLSLALEVKKRAYNPEILTSQKRQSARFHLQALDDFIPSTIVISKEEDEDPGGVLASEEPPADANDGTYLLLDLRQWHHRGPLASWPTAAGVEVHRGRRRPRY